MAQGAPKNPVVLEAHEVDTFHPPQKMLDRLEDYQQLYKQSITEPQKFWGTKARELLTWSKDFQTVHTGTLQDGDRPQPGRHHLRGRRSLRRAATLPTGSCSARSAGPPGSSSKWASKGRHGCRVSAHDSPRRSSLPLAITRIGAVHSVVFAGFSADSLRDRVIDAQSKVVITTDEGKRGGKLIGTKKIVDDALKQCPDVSHVLVYKRTGADVPFTKGRDWWWHEEVEKWPSYIAPEPLNSEDPAFSSCTRRARLANPRVSCTPRPATCWELP
ncbi:hypothetical protein OPQ81_005361 [Rhizoctonia solani]|nr:hypothetical protein OPQ81_005361 [Rhizoctonia solani]